jgi:hypothetical protein
VRTLHKSVLLGSCCCIRHGIRDNATTIAADVIQNFGKYFAKADPVVFFLSIVREVSQILIRSLSRPNIITMNLIDPAAFVI